MLVLARPQERNGFDLSMMAAVSDAVAQAEADPEVRAIIIAAEGRHFSSGATPDLIDHLISASPLVVQANVYATARGMVKSVYNCTKPTIAAVNGAAITLGCELALACDFRLIDETTYFQEAWITLGLLPPLGGMFLLPRMIGLARASEMVLQGRKVAADEAISIGLANELTTAEQLRERAVALAVRLAALPPHAYRLAKTGLHRGLESSMEAEWTANSLAQAVLMSSEDFAEGVDAARQGRLPAYTGR